MNKLIKLIVTILLTFIVSVGFAQINRKQIKRNNKAMANFKGKKNGFTEQKKYYYIKIGRAHVRTPVTFRKIVCRLLLEKKKNQT